MGRLYNGFNGGFSGRVGNIVGAHWRSIAYIRSAPKKSTKPRTEKQRAQEEKLALASHMLSPFRSVLEKGFRHEPGQGTGCNKASRILMTTAIRGTYPYYSIHYPSVKISMGGAEPASNPVLEATVDMLTLSWDGPEDPFNAEPEDKAVILILAEEKAAFILSDGEHSRMDGYYSISIGEKLDGCTLHGWIFFISARHGRCSESRYVSVRIPGETPAYTQEAVTLSARVARRKRS